MSLKIGMVARCLNTEHIRGMGKYVYELLSHGFGFPALEPQAAGTPVLFSPLGSLKELIGPLAIVVPPYDRDAWAAALDETAKMGEQRAERAHAAAEWMRRFAWSQSFDKHLAVYRKVGASQ